MKKPNSPTKNNIDTSNDNPKEMPEIPEHEVVEALIDRERDISPKNDKAK